MSGIVYNTSLLYGAISFIPGGLIVTDASMLSLIIQNGIDFSLASISVIIIRLFTLWISVFVGFLSIKFSKISISENWRIVFDILFLKMIILEINYKKYHELMKN